MFHAINVRLARLPRRTRARLALPFEYATWHGWQARQVSRGTWEFRDPRFGQRTADCLAAAAGTPARRSQAHTAIADRIQHSDTRGQHPQAGRGA